MKTDTGVHHILRRIEGRYVRFRDSWVQKSVVFGLTDFHLLDLAVQSRQHIVKACVINPFVVLRAVVVQKQVHLLKALEGIELTAIAWGENVGIHRCFQCS